MKSIIDALLKRNEKPEPKKPLPPQDIIFNVGNLNIRFDSFCHTWCM